MPDKTIMIVDDEPNALFAMEMTVKSAGLGKCAVFESPLKALEYARGNKPSAAVLDITMPQMSGIELLQNITGLYPDCPVIMVTGVNDLDTAVKCMKEGAFDYLVKPVERERLVITLKKAAEISEIREENAAISSGLSMPLKNPENFEDIITQDAAMANIFRYIEAVAPGKNPVLITGETGTGKELLARSIHRASGRKGEFIAVNAAGLDDNMFSDTLFGHKKGAFTGADSAREGLVKKANDGTLFLDEIGDLGRESQVKLLRLLQEGEYMPLGSDETIRTNARIVAATNKTAEELMDSALFRKDLYFRLRTHLIRVPALRERKTDIALLARYFSGGKKIDDSAILAFLGHAFTGNIRELQGMIADAAVMNEIITAKALGLNKKGTAAESPLMLISETIPTFEQAEEILVNEALKRSNGNQSAAAAMLGITRQAMNKRVKNMEKE